ncbi:MAG: dipeptide epimerase [Tissierellia bacterium]|nr:dipeptide epimerase [Tissierellia bacterium]
MIITHVACYLLKLPLKTPFQTALRRVEALEDVVVKITTDTGAVGYGEAPPTEVITGESIPSIVSAIQERMAPLLVGRDTLAMEENQRILHGAMVHNTSAKAAVDMALYDLFAQEMNQPLYRLLGGSEKHLTTDITISVGEVSAMVKDSLRAKELGYEHLKIKVGQGGSEDIERVEEIVRAVGPEVKIRLDANQGWGVREAISVLDELHRRDIALELVEQPVAYADLLGLREVKKHSPYPIMADEAVFSLADAHRVLDLQAADIINIKLMKTGGIHEALKLVDLAELYGVSCMMGCMLESKISVAAAAHLAGARENIRYIDLDGPNLTAVAGSVGGPEFLEGDIVLNDSPGIGIREVADLLPLGGEK